MAESVYYRFTTEGLPEDTFTVVRFTGEEAISELYRFRINLLSSDNDLDIDYLQDQPSAFVIGAGGHERTIQGIVTDVEIIDQPNGATVYRVELRPRAWELSRGSCHKVYLDTRTPDIIKQVLDQAGITETDYRLEMEEGEYREWEFRLQYGESYWNFLSRVLERDGVYYYFTAGDDVEKIHFCDSTRHQPSIANPELHFSTGLGMESPEVGETVHSLVTRRTSLLRSITLQNYNDAKPSTRINVTVDVDKDGAGAAHLYGQKVQDEAEAKALAGLRAEEMRAGKIVHHGESTVCLLSPAHRFGLDSHPRASMNEQEYQVISVEHSGYDPWAARQIGEEPEAGTPAYDNRFTAIAADTQYRHPQKTEKPTIDGTLNARIDAAGDGEYAELDEEGRYHIIFPFDTEHESGKASHWVRMMQPYAGEREGMHFPLRKGARVLISFLVGDPDLPVINGAIPNTEQPSTTTSDNHTCGGFRTPGGNWLETDDNFGQEHMNFFSSRMASAIHLGADISASGYGNSVGADSNSNDENGEDDEDEEEAHAFGEDPDPQADGILFETDGMLRTAYFGGTNRVAAATEWQVTDALWADAPQQRDDELRNSIDNIGKHSGDYWRIKHSRNRVFRFPRKSPHPDGGSADTITRSEESSGALLVNRTIGDEYTYRSGTTFHFHGIDRESFDFGTYASYSSTDHSTTSEDLRAIVSDSAPEFDNDTSDYQDQYRELMELRATYEEKRDEVAVRRHRFRVLDDEAKRALEDVSVPLDYQTVSESRAFAKDEVDQLEEWLLLRNGQAWSDQDSITEIEDTSNDKEYYLFAYKPFLRWEDGERKYGPAKSDLAERSPTQKGSIKEAEDDAEEAWDEYEKKRDKYKEDGHPEWPAALRSGRVRVTHDETYRWHQGRLYDFGGAAVYNFGGLYQENHVTGPVDMRDLDASDHEHDILSGITRDGRDSEWSGKLNGAIKSALDPSHNVLASKTIGDTYSYHKGTDINVHVGSTQVIRDEDMRVEIDYSGDDKTREFTSTGGADITKRWDGDGRLVHYNVDGYSFGHDEFTLELEYSNEATVKLAASATAEIELSAKTSLELTVGLETEIDIALAAKASLELEVGSFTEIKLPTLNHNEIKASTGVTTKVEKSSVDLEYKNGKGETKVAGMSLEKELANINKKATLVDKVGAAIVKKGISLEKGMLIKK